MGRDGRGSVISLRAAKSSVTLVHAGASLIQAPRANLSRTTAISQNWPPHLLCSLTGARVGSLVEDESLASRSFACNGGLVPLG